MIGGTLYIHRRVRDKRGKGMMAHFALFLAIYIYNQLDIGSPDDDYAHRKHIWQPRQAVCLILGIRRFCMNPYVSYRSSIRSFVMELICRMFVH